MDDLPELYALRTQVEVMKNTQRGKIDDDHAFTTTWMERFLPPNDAVTFHFVIEALSDPGHVVGVIGCHHPEPPEVGYMFKSEHWGKGYATEALKGWLAAYWSLPRREVEVDDDIPNLDRKVDGDVAREMLVAEIEFMNSSSRNVVQKCGFVKAWEQQIEDNHNPGGMVTLEHLYLERPMS